MNGQNYRDDEWDEEEFVEDDDHDDDDEDKEGGNFKSLTILERDIEQLSHHYPLWLDDDDRFLIVQAVLLPPGYDREETSLLIELPPDYPLTPPGISPNRLYVDPNLRFNDDYLDGVHKDIQPSWNPPYGPWAWFCYENIKWNPLTDNLITFIEMVRADFTNPPTK
jgi:hypothetical protein